jgi:MoxR-like ATPase
MADEKKKTEKAADKGGDKGGDKRSPQEVEVFQKDIGRLREEVGKVVVGNREVVDGVLTCMLAGSHALLEGVPGLGKTLLVRTMADAVSLKFARIQFTPDMMPADILGTTVIDEDAKGHRSFTFRKGPVFANIVLADEINRATPKTQSALLEAMQEHRVTIANTTHVIDQPFFVLATQNPLESEGTYPLPEAQLDRFFFKLNVDFPGRKELHAILERTTGDAMPEATQVLDRDRIIELQKLVREVPVARNVQDYAVRLIEATHPKHASANPDVKRFVNFGSSPRGAQAVLLASKITALFDGRFAPGIEDVKKNAMPALRHRVLLNFEGEAEGIKTDMLIKKILDELPESAK